MPKVGLEPTRAFAHYALNVARLPIPPLRLAQVIVLGNPFLSTYWEIRFLIDIRKTGFSGTDFAQYELEFIGYFDPGSILVIIKIKKYCTHAIIAHWKIWL